MVCYPSHSPPLSLTLSHVFAISYLLSL
jgi:hypothetical protein